MAAYYPAAPLTVVVLTNRGGAGADAIERRIARVTRRRAIYRCRARPRGRRLRYRHLRDHLVERDGVLTLEAPPPGPTTRLTHHGRGRFGGDADSDSIELLFHEGSPAPSVRLMMGAMYWYGERAVVPRRGGNNVPRVKAEECGVGSM